MTRVTEQQPQCVGVADIVAAVSAVSGVPEADLIGPGRSASVARARQVCYHIARAEGHTLSRIGRALGGRDHTTVLEGLRQVHERALLDAELRQLIAQARLQLRVTRACLDRTSRLRSKLLLRIHHASAEDLARISALIGEPV